MDVYITNIVKYRPPENRDPTFNEKIAFTPYLNKQLAIINPKLVVTLGRHSMEHFLSDKKISETHGESFSSSEGFEILVLYHPAAALYNRGLSRTLEVDFRKIVKILQDIN